MPRRSSKASTAVPDRTNVANNLGTNQATLGDIDYDGKVVKTRLGDAFQAQSFCVQMVQNNQIRDKRLVRVQGLIDGNAPYTVAELKRAGRGTDSNINWRGAKGFINNAWGPFVDITWEVPQCIDAELNFTGSPELDTILVREFCQEFHTLVFEEWEGFDYLTQLRDLQMLSHGVGTVGWMDQWDFRPKPFLTSNSYVSDRATCDLETNFSVFMATVPMEAGELWELVKDETAERQSSLAGWDVEAVKNAIMFSGRNNNDQLLGMKWDRWQQQFMNGDLYITQAQTNIIQLYYTWVKEMDGKISLSVLPVGTPASNAEKKSGYLFHKQGLYDEWCYAICPFFYDIGADGTWHSVKGLGTECAPYFELENRINNSTADMVLVGVKPMFQQTAGGDVQNLQMVKMGGFNIVPAGLNALSVNLGTNLQATLAVAQSFQNTLSKNTGSFHDDLAQPSVEETAKAVSIRAMDRSKLTKGAHNRQYRYLSRMYKEMWRRAVNPALKAHHPGAKLALAFQKRCYEICDKYDVPHGALQAVRNVRAWRAIGLGSPAMRLEIAENLMKYYPLYDPEGQRELLRMVTAAQVSYYNVDALVPPPDGRKAGNDDSIANLENQALNVGGTAVVTPIQNHLVHLEWHVGSAEEDQLAFSEGAMDMREAFGRIENKSPHAIEHLTYVQKNPMLKAQARDYDDRLNALAKFADQLGQHIEEQDAAAPPPEGEPSPEMVKVLKDAERKDIKMQADVQLKEQKQMANLQLQVQQMSQKYELEIAKLRAELGLKAMETQAYVQIDDGKAAAEIQRDNAKTLAEVAQGKEKEALKV